MFTNGNTNIATIIILVLVMACRIDSFFVLNTFSIVQIKNQLAHGCCRSSTFGQVHNVCNYNKTCKNAIPSRKLDRCRINNTDLSLAKIGLDTSRCLIRSRRVDNSIHHRYHHGQHNNMKRDLTMNIRGGALFLKSNGRKDDTSSRKKVPYYLLSNFTVWRSIAVTTCLLFLLRIALLSVLAVGSTPASTAIDSARTSASHGFVQNPTTIDVTAPWTGERCHDHHIPLAWLSSLLKKLVVRIPRNDWLLTCAIKVQDIALPLLSSACCAIQLFLNAVFAGAGCAGFNKVLGPLRPLFISLLLYNTFITFSMDRIWRVAVSWFVAFMPELVHIVNMIMSSSSVQKLSKQSTHGAIPGSHDKCVAIQLYIQDMGCVACINKIDGTLRASNPNVIQATSWLNEDGEAKGGMTRVVYRLEEASEEYVHSVTEAALKLVRDAGFNCEVQSVETVEE